MAVYAFFHQGQCLKVGKAGPNSEARYVSQHYSKGSSRSNLARSLAEHRASRGWEDLDRDHPGLWVRQHADRLNLLLDVELGLPLLTLLESFLQCRCKPRFEGPLVSDVQTDRGD
jgi:hypothetical protein